MNAIAENLTLTVTDVSEQKVKHVKEISPRSTVGELIEGLLPALRLPANDVEGRPLTYHARLEREGRHLHASEIVGDALETGDRVVLQPNIDAGGAWLR